MLPILTHWAFKGQGYIKNKPTTGTQKATMSPCDLANFGFFMSTGTSDQRSFENLDLGPFMCVGIKPKRTENYTILYNFVSLRVLFISF